jgi:sugar lactone lactonase YvrE
MNRLLLKQGALALALAIPFAGCSSSGLSALPGAGAGTGASAGALSPDGGPATSFLYVLDESGSSSSSSSSSSGGGSLNEYRKQGRPRLLNAVTNGISSPDAMAFDSHGNVYVVNGGGSSSSSSSSSGGGSVSTAGISNPRVLAVDSKNNLYVLNTSGSSSSSSSSGSTGSVSVYAPGRRNPIREITNGITTPMAMAVDAAGDIAVANGTGSSSSSSSSSSSAAGSVVFYNAGTKSPAETITSGITSPRCLAIDANGTIYVGNGQGGSSSSSSSSSSAGGSVTIYPPGNSSPSRTITDGTSNPGALAIAPNGELYVANAPDSSSSSSSGNGGGSIAVFLPGHSSAHFTIRRDINVPVALGVN